MLDLDLPRMRTELEGLDLLRVEGKLRSATGLLLTAALPAALGDQCAIQDGENGSIRAEVIGFCGGVAQLLPYEAADKVQPGMTVVHRGKGSRLSVGFGLLGRVLDGLGRPCDDRGPLQHCEQKSPLNDTPPPLTRARVAEPFITGQRVLDGLLTLGRGQRVGIFAGSGVGKSTLLGEIAKGSSAEINVLALIGERGREVRPFLEDCLGKEGLARSVVIVATCEQPALLRVRAAQTAIAIASHFREEGKHVLLLLDSLTRLAMAQRELGLALGEPPSARGYTPSVFQLLANTVERLGNAAQGSITGILTVLVDGGDLDEPISDATRGLLDGHLVLDRRLAEKGHFPAVNIARSISRIANEIIDPTHRAAAQKFRAIQALYADVEDLIRIGAYARGSSPQIDRAMDLIPVLERFLRQESGVRSSFADTKAALLQIAAAWPF